MKRNTFLVVASCLTMCVLTLIAQAAPQDSADSPEMQYLRRLIAEQQKNPDKILRTLPPTNSTTLNRTKPAATPVKTTTPASPALPVKVREASEKSKPVPAAEAAEAARKQKISEVETRLDEIARQKAAREKAALTNAAPENNSIPVTPQTRRQRLDGLLKQMIDGKISGAEYSEKREKILAEAD